MATIPDSRTIIEEAFDPIADIYESIPLVLKEDVAYWVALCSGRKGRVLELGCGTGRITIEIARAGANVVGIDLSQKMLDAAARNLSREPADVQSRVALANADMTDFDFAETFDVVVLPFFTLAVLPSRSDQERCIRCVKRHLSRDAFFAFDLSDLIQADPAELRWIPFAPERFRQNAPDYAWEGRMHRDAEGILYLNSTLSFKTGAQAGQTRAWKMRLIPTPDRTVRELISSCGLALSETIRDYDRPPQGHKQGTTLYIVRHAREG